MPEIPLLGLAAKGGNEGGAQGPTAPSSDKVPPPATSSDVSTNPSEMTWRYGRGKRLRGSAATEEFDVQGHPHLIMKVTRVPPGEVDAYVSQLQELKTKEESLAPGGGVAKLIDMRPLDGEVEEVYERAPGNPLYRASGSEPWSSTVDRREWQSRIEQLSLAPQEQFDRLVARIRELENLGIHVDANKADNFFYDSKVGFTIIDLGDPRRSALTSNAVPELTAVLISPHSVQRNSEKFSAAVYGQVEAILQKLKKAGSQLKDSEQSWFDDEMRSLFAVG